MAVTIIVRRGGNREIACFRAVTARVEAAGVCHQFAGVLAVGDLHDFSRAIVVKGVKHFPAVFRLVYHILVQLGHDQIKQLVGRIALQVAERLRIGIAIPDRADIIRRVADKPAVVIVTCRTGLTGDIHRIAQRDTATGTVVHDILHHLGHDVGSRFAKHDLTLLTVV